MPCSTWMQESESHHVEGMGAYDEAFGVSLGGIALSADRLAKI